MVQSLFVSNNVIPQVGQCVASPRTTSGQGCVCDQTFFLFMYNQDFQLKCSVTAGALGEGTGGQWTATRDDQFSLRKDVSMNISFTNYWSAHGDLQGVVGYIDKNLPELSPGFHIWVVNYEELSVSLIPYPLKGSLATSKFHTLCSWVFWTPLQSHTIPTKTVGKPRECIRIFIRIRHVWITMGALIQNILHRLLIN